MKTFTRTALILVGSWVFLLSTFDRSLAQLGVENCNNGIDDDGDGHVDCYDSECDCDVTSACSTYQPPSTVFDITQGWRSAQRTASSRVVPLVADVDGDGVTEVITYNEDNTIYILDGRNGTVERSHTYDSNPVSGGFANPYLAVGDIDRDGYSEIFHIERNGWIRAFTYDLKLLWKDQMNFTQLRPPALADFNGDGKAELYYGNEIRDALTGGVIVAGSHGTSMYPSGNDWQQELGGLSVAVDILSDFDCAACGGLELVLGHIIYAVDVENKALVEVKVMDKVGEKVNYTGDYYPKDIGWGGHNYSYTSVVDFNLDGQLDVLVSGATGSPTGPSTVFLWDMTNDRAKAFVVTRSATEFHGGYDIKKDYQDLNGGPCDGSDACTWRRGVSALGVANIDADPEPECFFSSGSSLYAINHNMELEWANHEDFWESTSGITGATAFDFDGDGAAELIYRDEVDAHVVDGWSGQVLNSPYTNLLKCSSQTLVEYPVVADVDQDGEAELLLSCSAYENGRFEAANTGGSRNPEGHIRMYKSPQEAFWPPARDIWNQFAYYNVNVNDDLSIPTQQKAHHLSFTQTCTDPYAPNRFPLNRFLNQAPYVDNCGKQAFLRAQLKFVGEGVIVTPPVCREDSLSILLSFENVGDKPIKQPIPFSFYARDPAEAYRNADPNPWLDTLYLEVPGGVAPGQRVDTTVVVRGARGQYLLYTSMNDVGPFQKYTRVPVDNDIFYPLNERNGTVYECDNTPTIVAQAVDPRPFPLSVSTVDDHRCGEPGSSNGAIKITDEQGQPLTPLSSYQLFLTELSTEASVDLSGSVVNTGEGTYILGLDSGNYQLKARYHGSFAYCDSQIETVRIDRTYGWPDSEEVSIQKIKDVSSCQPGTADGEAQVLINGELADHQIYQVEWQNEQDPYDVTFGAHAIGLKPLTYQVLITNMTTGCEISDLLPMDLELPRLDNPTVVSPTDCGPADGSITARIAAGNTAELDFVLIRKNSPQDTTVNSTGAFNDLKAGIYELKAINIANDCGWYGEGRIVELSSEEASDTAASLISGVVASVLSPNRSCDPTFRTGAARVTPPNGESFGELPYAFLWQDVSTGQTVGDHSFVENLTAGTYSALVSYRCHYFTDTITIEDQPPSIDNSQVDIQTFPQTSAERPNGAVTVSLSDTTYDNYSFLWTDMAGNTISMLPTATNLTHGAYQVTITHTFLRCSQTYEVIVANEVPRMYVFSVTFDEVPDKTYGDDPFVLSVNNPSRRAIALQAVAGNVFLEDTVVHIRGAGAVTIEAVPVNDTDHLAETARVSFMVHKQTQAISNFMISPVSDSTFRLSAQASSGLPVTYQVANGNARIADRVLTIRTSDVVVVEAAQAGNDNYHEATPLKEEVTANVVTALPDEKPPATVRIYPNPSESGMFWVDSHYPSNYTVVNNTGNLVYRGQGSGTTALDLRNVSAGVYVVRVVSPYGTSYHKLIKR